MIWNNVKEVIVDWGRYMDTVIPRGVDRQMFLHLKYSNKSKLEKFHQRHDLIDGDLVEKVALHEFMKLPEERIVKECLKYMEH